MKIEYFINSDNRNYLNDPKVLTYLYQPILGSEALSLYNVLIQESQIFKELLKESYLDIKRLTMITGQDTDTLRINFKKLDAMNLLKIYKKVSKVDPNVRYVRFKLLPALNSYDFFNNLFFANALLNTLDEENYEICRYIFKDKNQKLDTDFEEIDTKFSDIFSNKISQLDKTKEVLNLNNSTNQTNKSINWDEFNKRLIENDIVIKFEEEKELKKSIISIFESINITQAQMIKFIKTQYTKDKKVDLEVLIFMISVEFNNILNKPNNNVKNINKSDIVIEEMEKYDSEVFLKSLLDVYKLNYKHINLIDRLRNIYKLKDSIINCLLQFSYFKNNKIISENYLIKIAGTISESHLKSTKDVMDYLKLSHKKSNTKKPTTSKSKDKKEFTDWDDIQENKGYVMNVDSLNSDLIDDMLKEAV